MFEFALIILLSLWRRLSRRINCAHRPFMFNCDNIFHYHNRNFTGKFALMIKNYISLKRIILLDIEYCEYFVFNIHAWQEKS